MPITPVSIYLTLATRKFRVCTNQIVFLLLFGCDSKKKQFTFWNFQRKRKESTEPQQGWSSQVRLWGAVGTWGPGEAPPVCAPSPPSTDGIGIGEASLQNSSTVHANTQPGQFLLCFQEDTGTGGKERYQHIQTWEKASLWELKFALVFPSQVINS